MANVKSFSCMCPAIFQASHKNHLSNSKYITVIAVYMRLCQQLFSCLKTTVDFQYIFYIIFLLSVVHYAEQIFRGVMKKTWGISLVYNSEEFVPVLFKWGFRNIRLCLSYYFFRSQKTDF